MEGLQFHDLPLEGLVADGVSAFECCFSRCALGDTGLRHSRLVSCVWQEVTATTWDCVDSSWLDVAVGPGRIGALLAQGSRLMRVTLADLKLDYVNLRGATLDQVRFTECRIAELDLSSADLRDVRMDGCVIGRLVLSGSTCSDVRLEDAELAALDGLGSLAGVTVSELQLLALAPALAAHLGLTVLSTAAGRSSVSPAAR